MANKKYKNPFMATINGIAELFKKYPKVDPLKDFERIDGKTCLVTGANSGLGFAIAVHLAKRGGHVIMACRSGIPEAGEKVKELSGSDKVEMMKIDLSDIDSIHAFCDEIKKKGVKIDIAISNAAVVPGGSRKTPQGFEQMFMVNYLAKFILFNRLLKDGVIPNQAFGQNKKDGDRPRIIFVASESHRSGDDLNFEKLGVYEDFSMGKVVDLYGYYKMALITFARELNRRLNPDGKVDVAVHTLCPGPVNSNIAREAPTWAKPLVNVTFSLFFTDPVKAAEPVIYLAVSKDLNNKTDKYMHLMSLKEPDERTGDESSGRRLWERSSELITLTRDM
jgi:NAD(P)-dependent dehydrogenase (short-subunit alcohol dehydrogenase family)